LRFCREVTYFCGVPESSERQQLIGFRADPELLAEIDAKRGRMSRSEFLRRAVFAELEELGTTLPPSITAAPDRAGKGGPKKREAVDSRLNEGTEPAPAAEKARKKTSYKTAKKKAGGGHP
jgi:hypothetical protein